MQANPSQQPLQLDAVHGTVEQAPAWQTPPAPHAAQVAPASPHWLLLWLPRATQAVLLQQPVGQVLALQTPLSGTQEPPWHRSPELHDAQKAPGGPQCSGSVPEKHPPSASQQPVGHTGGQSFWRMQVP
jgi:hypothetical protein